MLSSTNIQNFVGKQSQVSTGAMSDSDAEFEKFLQESLSSSGVSYKSLPSHSSVTAASRSHGFPSVSRQGSELILSDRELEATGNSWLKSSNPLRPGTLANIGQSRHDNYSSDSLDMSRDAGYSRSKQVAISDDSAMTETHQKPGLDTLEENADKNKFFAELEKGRDTPIDYSELNKKLSETGRSSVIDTATSSLASENNLAERYKEDFDSLSSTVGSSSSDTITSIGARAGGVVSSKATDDPNKRHGFTLSPIHISDVHSSSVTDSRSDFEHSAVFASIQSPKDDAGVDKSAMRSPSKPKLVASEVTDGKLLKSRSSKSLSLNAEQTPPPAPPTSSILPPAPELISSTESTKSIVSPPSLKEGGQRRKFGPLAPIASDSVVSMSAAASDHIHKVDSITEGTCILQPLEIDCTPTRVTVAADLKSRASRSKVESSASHILSPPICNDKPETGKVHGDSGDSKHAPLGSRKLTNIPSSSSLRLHHNGEGGEGNDEAMADSLTAVTDVPNSTLGGGIDSEMAELQNALVQAGLPPINTGGSKSESSIAFQPTAMSHVPTRETVEMSEHSMDDSDIDIQEIIRAITTEELTTASKEILEASPRKDSREVPSTATRTLRGTHKVRAASAGSKKGELKKTKPVWSSMAKQKTQLSSSRESLASRNDSSFRKCTTDRPKGKGSGPGKRNDVTAGKKTKLPQRSGKPGDTRSRYAVKANLKSAQQSPKFSPRAPSPSSRQEERNVPSDSEVSDTCSSEKGQKSSYSERLMVEIEPVTKELAPCAGEQPAPGTDKQLALLEMGFKEREKQMKLLHEREITELKQELFSKSVKLKDLEMAQDSRKLLASGKDPDMVISQEEKACLQREIKEQEVLLQGYQKENERLCAELSKHQVDSKSSLSRLYQENQQLASQLALTRAQAEVQSRRQPLEAMPPAGASTNEVADMAAAQIARLEDCLEREGSEKKDLQNQVKQLKHLSHSLEQEVRSLKHSNKELENSVQERVKGEVLERLKEKHQEETVRLTEKLAHYADKLKLLDHTSELLKTKEAEVSTLKEQVTALESSKAKSSAAKASRVRSSEAKRVVQLERQVKELEKVIQKRFPNSLSALILAANGSAELELQNSKQVLEAQNKELEESVRDLKAILETAEKESKRKYSALQQDYTNLQMKYELQTATLNQLPGGMLVPPQGRSPATEKHKEKHKERSPHSKHSPHSNPPPPHHHHSNPPPHHSYEGLGDTAAVMLENAKLKEKLSEVSFELAHQRVQLEGRLAEAERKSSLIGEEAQKKLSSLKEEHIREVDSLLAKFARDHALSDATRLHSQVKAKEATIVLLREKVSCLEREAGELVASKAREEKLLQQLQTTSEELREARKAYTPEMHHFMLLQTKIASLEERNRDFEAKNRLLWQSVRQSTTAETDTKDIEHKWRCQLVAKNAEIEQYREELDSLLAALRVLQHTGN